MARFSTLLCVAVLAVAASLASADPSLAVTDVANLNADAIANANANADTKADAIANVNANTNTNAEAATSLRGFKPLDADALPLMSLDEAASSGANDTAAAQVPQPTPTVAPRDPVATPTTPNLHPFIALVMAALVLCVTNNVAGADSIAAISSTAGILSTVFALVMGLDLKAAVALSVVTIAGGNLGTFVENVCDGARDAAARPLIDWDLLLVVQPTLMLGVLFGVFVRHVLMPAWLLSTVLATALLVCGSLLLQASHRRPETEAPEAVSINEASALVDNKPPHSGPAPPFSIAVQTVPLNKLGVLVGVVFGVAVLHAALVVAVPIMLLGYLAYKAHKTTAETVELQQLPRASASEGEIKWTGRMVWIVPVLSTFSGLATGAIGFGSDLVIVPYLVECGLDRAVAASTGSTIVLLTCLMTAFECIVLGSVSFTVVILAMIVGFVVKEWGHLALERGLSESLRRPSFLAFSFAVCTLIAGIALAIASI